MALTAKEQKTRWDNFVQWYEEHVASLQIGKPIPKELKKLYMANNGAWGTERALMWIRLNDPNYLRTPEAQERLDGIKSLYEMSLGYKINWKDPRMAKYAEAFARANPNIKMKRRLTEIFMQRIMKSKEFQKANPGFASWLSKNRSEYTDATSILEALKKYNEHKETLTDYWQSVSTQPIPKDLIDEALANDWAADNLQFKQAMTATPEWAAGASYTDRAQEFAQQWEAIFGTSVPVDAAMQDAYSRNITGLTFQDFFHATLKHTKLFKDTIPGYSSWEAKRHAQGKVEKEVDIFSYFERRNELIEMWNENFTGGELPDEALLSEALDSAWGDAMFLNKLRATPAYANTGAGKERAARFDNYWKGLFGSESEVDSSLRSRFISSDATDPGVYWDEIQKTDQFKKQYSNWDIFSQAQTDTGVSVVDDPTSYKRYLSAMKEAFADAGVEDMPPGMEKNIFASGVSAEDIQSRAKTWKTTKEATYLQTGETPDLVTTIGTAKTPATSAAMRDRMEKALEQQRVLHKSRFAGTQETVKDNLVTQKI